MPTQWPLSDYWSVQVTSPHLPGFVWYGSLKAHWSYLRYGDTVCFMIWSCDTLVTVKSVWWLQMAWCSFGTRTSTATMKTSLRLVIAYQMCFNTILHSPDPKVSITALEFLLEHVGMKNWWLMSMNLFSPQFCVTHWSEWSNIHTSQWI